MEIRPSNAILSALASLQQGGTGARPPAAQGNTGVQTVEAVPRVAPGVDIKIGGEAERRGSGQREAPGANTRPLQPGLGRIIDLSV
ncbi:hypothetical protein [Zavarzinia compransoris]|uniref:Uncharacterized protein n=1 Tax=Zavarzinia compransoris TaxID=1264899 RepID=A0A317EA75_9PROT|nr:hypothetical protein [Zavarzinia compransoris]PWR22075.1 hypothetical protein DKG75_08855 [Zavarzinia compransoris]TDP47183.1 hypothetical protein DES42_103354 [Zavarzinia compransoris]